MMPTKKNSEIIINLIRKLIITDNRTNNKPLDVVEERKEETMYGEFERLCTENGLTAYKVCQETGISRSTISDWKSGRSKPKVEKLLKIADFFEVPVTTFIRKED